MSEQAEPAPAVVEWGSERRSRLDLLAGLRWHPRLARVVAGLGAVALFGSLVGEWQTITLGAELAGPEIETLSLGAGETLSWGAVWMVGALLLVVATGLALFGQPAARHAARSIGLVLAGVMFGFLVAAAIALSERSWFTLSWITVEDEVEFALGRGVYAAFASVVLLGAAAYLARVPASALGIGAAAEPAGPPARAEPGAAESWAPPPRQPDQRPAAAGAGPADLTVAPAEPFSHLTDEQEWR